MYKQYTLIDRYLQAKRTGQVIRGAYILPHMSGQISIISSSPSDLDNIFWFYDQAIAFQKKVFHKNWLGFDRGLVEREIKEGRQFRIILDGVAVCVFLISLDDRTIWKELDNDNALYLHRIVTHPEYRGRSFVATIIRWAKAFCMREKREYIRLDTWSDNLKLIEYYRSSGFRFVKNTVLDDIEGLPEHYQWELALLEIRI